MNFAEALERIRDGVPTAIIPYFLATPRENYIYEVIQRIEIQSITPKPSRIYLVYQEGISEKKGKDITTEISKRVEHINAENLEVRSFGNVPTDILFSLMDALPVICQ